MTEPIWEKGYTQNRELSWLQFNARVLEEAEDETVPLLERVKFLSIFTSNLDEFYMIRVGSLGDVAALGGHGVDNKSGLTAKEQLERIYAATAPLYERRDRVFRRVERELGAEGLQRLRMSELTQDEHHYIRQLFRTAIQPLLSPQIVDAHHPFPHLASKTLHVGVRLSRKKSEFWGLIPMPPSVPELLFLPEQNGICRYVPLEEVLLFYADSVFEMYSTLEKVVFCVTRNADINPDDEPFAPDGREIDLRAKMEKLLRERRRRGACRAHQRALCRVVPQALRYLRRTDLRLLRGAAVHGLRLLARRASAGGTPRRPVRPALHAAAARHAAAGPEPAARRAEA